MVWKHLLSTILFSSISILGFAQFTDRQSDFKYYYKLDAKDIQELLKSDDPEIKLSHLHTFVDSVQVDSTWMMGEFGLG